MKNQILLPLFLGLALAGCTRTNTDAQRLSSNDQSSDPSKPLYNAQTDAARKDAADQAQVATAVNPNPAAGKAPTADTSASMAANSTPLTAPSAPATTTIASSAGANAISNQPAKTDTTGIKPELSARIAEWKLNPEDIKSELETSGRIVRSRTAGAGEPTGPMDNVLIGQITSTLEDNAATSALKLGITADHGVVTLKGSAHSLSEIGQAIALALDTPGVTQTIAEVKLETSP